MIIARVIAEPARLLSAHCEPAVVHAIEARRWQDRVHGADPLPMTAWMEVAAIMADGGEPAALRGVLDRHFFRELAAIC